MTVATPTLAEFLLARIAEDERWAQAVAGIDYGAARDRLRPDDHSRVLRDCRAKRRIVTRHTRAAALAGKHPSGEVAEMVLRTVLEELAEAYDAHPDHREEWRP